MNYRFVAAISRATEAVRANDLTGSMRLIQDALSQRDPEQVPATKPEPVAEKFNSAARLIDAGVTELRQLGLPSPDASKTAVPPAQREPSGRPRRPLPEVLGALSRGLSGNAFRSLPAGKRFVGPPPIPEGAQFAERVFSCDAGTRNYKVYIPACVRQGREASGLIVMLHGCKQNPDDFATGTRMNAEGETHGLIVAYPSQPASANPSSCWNWFSTADQSRGVGEPAILAGLTQALSSEFEVSRARVFVAGLSAGGAMAVVMGATYPDLYSAVGVHSGLAYRAASDVVTAFAAMRGDLSATEVASKSRPLPEAPRTIVFHGSADQTVHPTNADQIIVAATAQSDARRSYKDVESAHGRNYIRTTFSRSDGETAAEHWLIQNSGHAWCGGDANGSFTDRLGPNASAEMVRFFLSSPS